MVPGRAAGAWLLGMLLGSGSAHAEEPASPPKGAPPTPPAPTSPTDGAAPTNSVGGAAPKETAAPRSAASPAIDTLLLPAQLTMERGRPYPALARRRAQIDEFLADSAQDLGLAVSVGEPASLGDEPLDEHTLAGVAKRARKLTVVPLLRVGPRERKDGTVELRLVAARPDRRPLLTRVERVSVADVAVRAAVMLRDIAQEVAQQHESRPVVTAPPAVAQHERSLGPAVLAANGAAFGGYVGLALQRASGSDDPRLLYPLLGVGAGLGLGAALLITNEWEVSVGDAWYVASGAWWPAVASHLIYEGRWADRPSVPDGEQWAFSLVASATGLGLASVGLLGGSPGDAGAALAHSGGAVGLLIGGLAEFMGSGVADEIPLTGMGCGAMAGWVLGVALAPHVHPPVDNLLGIDLGSLLGTATGAAAASPLLFDEANPNEVRGWVGASAGGLVLGALLGWYLTSELPSEDTLSEPDPTAVVSRWRLPTPTLLATAPTRLAPAPASGHGVTERSSDAAPAIGMLWQAELW